VDAVALERYQRYETRLQPNYQRTLRNLAFLRENFPIPEALPIEAIQPPATADPPAKVESPEPAETPSPQPKQPRPRQPQPLLSRDTHGAAPSSLNPTGPTLPETQIWRNEPILFNLYNK
jgi:hypothetical protein